MKMVAFCASFIFAAWVSLQLTFGGVYVDPESGKVFWLFIATIISFLVAFVLLLWNFLRSLDPYRHLKPYARHTCGELIPAGDRDLGGVVEKYGECPGCSGTLHVPQLEPVTAIEKSEKVWFRPSTWQRVEAEAVDEPGLAWTVLR